MSIPDYALLLKRDQLEDRLASIGTTPAMLDGWLQKLPADEKAALLNQPHKVHTTYAYDNVAFYLNHKLRDEIERNNAVGHDDAFRKLMVLKRHGAKLTAISIRNQSLLEELSWKKDKLPYTYAKALALAGARAENIPYQTNMITGWLASCTSMNDVAEVRETLKAMQAQGMKRPEWGLDVYAGHSLGIETGIRKKNKKLCIDDIILDVGVPLGWNALERIAEYTRAPQGAWLSEKREFLGENTPDACTRQETYWQRVGEVGAAALAQCRRTPTTQWFEANGNPSETLNSVLATAHWPLLAQAMIREGKGQEMRDVWAKLPMEWKKDSGKPLEDTMQRMEATIARTAPLDAPQSFLARYVMEEKPPKSGITL